MLGTFTTGLATVFEPFNLFLLVVGLVAGMLAGILPGLTLVMGLVLALPFTYGLGPIPAVVLLMAMYVAGTYGGAFTAILFRIPGEPFDIPLLWDGHAMARRGQAAKALGYTLFAAMAGGLFSLIVSVSVAKPFADIALSFSAPEFFALIVFGIASVVSLSGGSLLNGLISLLVGLLVATVGVDGLYGADRFSFGWQPLTDGIDYIAVMIGAYGLGEVFSRLERGFATTTSAVGPMKPRLPSFAEMRAVKGAFFRSASIGVLIGLVPGAGATVASFIAYGAEGHYGRQRARLGTGVPDGIVAPQAASTASVGGAMVCLLTLGIPGSGAAAVIFGALMLHGLQPGPQVFVTSPEIAYAVFATMMVGLVGMVLIGWIFIRGLVRVLQAPEAVVSAFIVMMCLVGALATRNNLNDLWIVFGFGVLGWIFERTGFPTAPMILGAILGPLAETNLLTTLIGARNDWSVFLTRPVALALFAVTLFLLLLPILRSLRDRRRLAVLRPSPVPGE
jgi:putative tricarboxylic transport membrane protein